MKSNFSKEVQEVLLSFMISDRSAYAQSQNIIKSEYFDSQLQGAVEYIVEYADKYKTLPDSAQIFAETDIQITHYPTMKEEHTQWYMDTIEEFCRFKAMENVILEGPDLLDKGAAGEIEKRFKEAVTISLVKDLGTSYFDDPTERLSRLKDKSNFVSTGIKSLDDKLYGGFTKGALNIFAGGSGSGKSLFLQNIALNWALAGLNTIYFSLELSEDLVSMRIDSMTSKYSTKEILKSISQVSHLVKMAGRGAGDLRIKKLPEAGTTANDLRAYIKEYEIKTGRKVDAIAVDYLDLMHPNNSKIDPGNLFTKDKFVSEELRALAGELGVVFVTASQLNRQSVEAAEFDHSHIAGGISKINTADNVFGIFATAAMKEKGEYELQFLKTRSSSSVGQRIKLAYCQDSLRITDAVQGSFSSTVGGMSGASLGASLGTTVRLPSDIDGEIIEPVDDQPISENEQKMIDLMARVRR